MGILIYPRTIDEVVVGHIESMRAYADTLAESRWPFLSRAKVIARVRKCASEVERAQAAVHHYHSRQGHGGDAPESAAPALLTGPTVEDGDAQEGAA